jgi:serine/threonine protein kinase
LALTPGTRLGVYEVTAQLGEGGMGEVYKGRDTRLDRTVAIKVLHESLSSDPQFRQRFDREARAISQLTHPHVCTLYDIGEQAGTAFLVMEFLEGETLADRLSRGVSEKPPYLSMKRCVSRSRLRTPWLRRITRASFIGISSPGT